VNKESRLKSLVKGVSWRIIGTFDTVFIAFIITGSGLKAVSIGGIEFFTKIILYYLHERVWLRVPNNLLKNLDKISILRPFTNNSVIDRAFREDKLQQKGLVLWMTGLSGSGKTTIANYLEKILIENRKFCVVLDGDTFRHGLNSDLGFSEIDRTENIRRIAEIAKHLASTGVIVVVALITPKNSMRKLAKDIVGEKDFRLVYIKSSLEVCEQRDIKGLYAKARQGEVKNFTGIGSEYEAPSNPDLTLDTETNSVDICVELLNQMVEKRYAQELH
jgi:adenylylsulfate kinase